MSDIQVKFPIHGVLRVEAQMLTDQTDATDGEWVDFIGIREFGIHVKTLSGSDAVEIRVSNEITKPADNTHGLRLGSTIRADRMIISEKPFRWVKVRKIVGGGSATNAFLLGDWKLFG